MVHGHADLVGKLLPTASERAEVREQTQTLNEAVKLEKSIVDAVNFTLFSWVP